MNKNNQFVRPFKTIGSGDETTKRICTTVQNIYGLYMD